MFSHLATLALTVGHPGRNIYGRRLEMPDLQNRNRLATNLDLFIFQKGLLHNPPRKYFRKRKVIIMSLFVSSHHITDVICTLTYSSQLGNYN